MFIEELKNLVPGVHRLLRPVPVVVVIPETVAGSVVTGEENLDCPVTRAFASDLMSDVLTVKSDNLVLLTGLVNIQTLRTAEMSDIGCVIFVRNKKVTPEMIRLARAAGKPVLVDPKGEDYVRYAGATLLTPNRSELRQVVGR